MAPGSSTCGPFGEDGTYTSASGQVYQGTRVGLGPNYGDDRPPRRPSAIRITTLWRSIFASCLGKQATLLAGYTYSKSIDDASNLGEQINPFNDRAHSRDFFLGYDAQLRRDLQLHVPFDRYFKRNRLTEGWTVSGTTRFSTGFPVTLFDNSDRSLLGTLGNGVNNQLLDTPQLLSGPLEMNTNPRNGSRRSIPAFWFRKRSGS